MSGDEFKPAWAFAPGEYIRDEMRERGLSLRELAVSLHMARAAASRLLCGERRLDEYIANRLELLFGSSAETWLNLETAYRNALARGCHDATRRS